MSILESSAQEPNKEPGERPSGLFPGSFSNSPYWLIVRVKSETGTLGGSADRRTRGLEVLSLEAADGKVLPVFGSKERGRLFVTALSQDQGCTEGVQSEWWPRGTGVGELMSLLSGSAYSAGPCTDVETIIFDPPSEVAAEARHGREVAGAVDLAATNTVSRRCFLETLMGRGRPWFETRDKDRE